MTLLCRKYPIMKEKIIAIPETNIPELYWTTVTDASWFVGQCAPIGLRHILGPETWIDRKTKKFHCT